MIHPRNSVALVACAFLTLFGAFGQPQPAAPRRVDFDREIRPILSDNCFQCHGPDEKNRMAGLRLDTRDGAFADRGKNKTLAPGDPASSRVYLRVSAENKARRMPPPSSGRALTDPQIALIKRWIEEGADWKQHWAFIPPKRADLPDVKHAGWVRNPVDRFVLARLEREGLSPSPEADRITLLRRVTFDLTGLPPTPAEIDAFLDDKSSGRLRETVVDRLLASPHYGERMALHWLDLARYADTHGYHIDSAPRDVAVARLGDRRLQPQHAVRPVHHRAARRRSAAECHADQQHRHRLSTATT